MLVDRLEEKGVFLELDGDNLRAKVQGEMTDEQRAFLRQHRQELKAELRSRMELPEGLKAKLQRVVAKLTADCVSWYRDDAKDIARMSETDLERIVLDFLARRDWYHRSLAPDEQRASA